MRTFPGESRRDRTTPWAELIPAVQTRTFGQMLGAPAVIGGRIGRWRIHRGEAERSGRWWSLSTAEPQNTNHFAEEGVEILYICRRAIWDRAHNYLFS